jgi:hypothetical protein
MGVPWSALHRCSSTFGKPVRYGGGSASCGRSSMAEPQPSKLVMRVRFPSPAPTRNHRSVPLSASGTFKIRKPQSVGVPVACPMDVARPAASPPPASALERQRSPRPGRGRRAGRSARRASLSGPSAPSARAGPRPKRPCGPSLRAVTLDPATARKDLGAGREGRTGMAN